MAEDIAVGTSQFTEVLHKHCPRCDKDKPLSEFKVFASGFYANRPYIYCNDCRRGAYSTYYRDNSKAISAKTTQRNKEKPQERRRIRISSYGITEKQFEGLRVAQDDKCAICGKEFSSLPQSPDIDHCHETDVVRGLLCNQCNRGLGLFKDSLTNLQAAVTYLLRHHHTERKQ